MTSGEAASLQSSGWRMRGRAVWRSTLRTTAAALLVVYLGWQVYWLAQASVPPALFLAFTDLPSPTTGGLRSLAALIGGNWQLSLHHNPMAVPLTGLFFLTLTWLCVQRVRQTRLQIPNCLFIAWLGLLSTAWTLKLLQHVLSAGF